MAALRIARKTNVQRIAIVDDESTDAQIPEWEVEPVLLSTDEANADTIKRGIEHCVLELQGHLPETRIPYRTLLRIIDITDESNEKVVDAIIPGWNPRRAVRFPLSLIPSELQDKLAPDVALFARINIGAEKDDDLYFREFEGASFCLTILSAA